MPNMYSKYHDEFLKNYLEYEESAEILGKWIMIPAKNKLNYIFPV